MARHYISFMMWCIYLFSQTRAVFPKILLHTRIPSRYANLELCTINNIYTCWCVCSYNVQLSSIRFHGCPLSVHTMKFVIQDAVPKISLLVSTSTSVSVQDDAPPPVSFGHFSFLPPASCPKLAFLSTCLALERLFHNLFFFFLFSPSLSLCV